MKRIQLFSTLFFVMMSVSAYTQNENAQRSFNKKTHPGIAQSEVAAMKEKLNLTNAQASELEAVENNLHTAFFAPAKDSAVVTARKEKIEKLQRDKEAAFQKILTPGQWAAYQAYMEEKRKRALAEIEERRKKAREANAGGVQN